MKTFYFVGGPRRGHEEEFFRLLRASGGAPSGWQIYPHVADARALHIVTAASTDEIHAHLRQFGEIYEAGEIVEVRARDA